MNESSDSDDDMPGLVYDKYDQDDDDEGEELFIKDLSPAQDLFSSKTFTTAQECLEHCRLINYIRVERPSPGFVMSLSSDQKWSDQSFLKPVIQDDPLLMYDFEHELELNGLEEEDENGFEIDISRELNDQIANPNSGKNSSSEPIPNTASDSPMALLADINAITGDITLPASKLEELRGQFEAISLQLTKKENELRSVLEDMEKMKNVAQTFFTGGDESTATKSSTRRRKLLPVSEARTVEEDHSYFESYAHYSIHYEMLSDHTRTSSYRSALLDNSSRLNDALVLDIGCGTGILSMFAAQAGARSVVGVDCSEVIYQAMDIVRENNLDNKIALVKGRLEEAKLPHDKFDIIVSEWMGYFLLFEGMLDSVLAARDKYLSPGGTILPNRCTINLAALSDEKRYGDLVDFWSDVYGFKMSCMRSPILEEASVEVVPAQHVVSNCVQVLDLDINTCTVPDTEFKSDFVFEISRDCALTAVIGYFDTFFDLECSVMFSTGPQATPTHWKQTVFYLPEKINVTNGQNIQGRIVCKRMINDVRALKVALHLDGKEYRYTVD